MIWVQAYFRFLRLVQDIQRRVLDRGKVVYLLDSPVVSLHVAELVEPLGAGWITARYVTMCTVNVMRPRAVS